jgi:hypothetical protein
MEQDNPQQADVAYAAGFFDGEGSAMIYVGSGKNRDGIVFAVCMWQSSLPVLDWLQETFGGGVYRRKNAGYGLNSKRSAAEWRIVGHAAYGFCRLIRPYLRVRHEKIDEVMWKWERRAAAETEWSDCPFDEKKTRADATVRSAGIAQPAEAAEMTALPKGSK